MALATVTHLSSNGGTNVSERLLLDAVGHAIVVSDLKGEITFRNAAAETIYGWAARDVLGSTSSMSQQNVNLTAPRTTRTGFGDDLIKRAFMGGLVEYNLGIDGLKCRITIPLPAETRAAA